MDLSFFASSFDIDCPAESRLNQPMWNSKEYQLLDFGQGRKLESFGGCVVDRPCPAAFSFDKRDRELWGEADLAFDGPKGPGWIWNKQQADSWRIRHRSVVLNLETTPLDTWCLSRTKPELGLDVRTARWVVWRVLRDNRLAIAGGRGNG